MDVWGSITRVESRVRMPALLAAAAVLAVGLVTVSITRTGLVLPRVEPPKVIVERQTFHIFQDRVFKELAAAKRARQVYCAGYAKAAAFSDSDLEIRDAVVEMGYLKADDDPSEPLASMFGREEIWARVIGSPRDTGNAALGLTEQQEANLTKAAMAILAADPRLGGKGIGVSAAAPVRTWASHRAIIGVAGAGMSLLAGVPGLWLGWLELSTRARPRRIRAGLCPRCAYQLAGSDVERCPECGQPLTLHERSVLAAMLQPHRRASALPV